jgi:hypothetical protein
MTLLGTVTPLGIPNSWSNSLARAKARLLVGLWVVVPKIWDFRGNYMGYIIILIMVDNG